MAFVQSRPGRLSTSGDRYSEYVTEGAGLCTLAAALFIFASFASYHLGTESRWGGVLGHTLARTLAGTFGYAVYSIPVALAVVGLRFLRGGLDDFPLTRLGAWGVFLLFLSASFGLMDAKAAKGLGGWFGGFLGRLFCEWCGMAGASIVCVVSLLFSASYIAGTTPLGSMRALQRRRNRPRIGQSYKVLEGRARVWDLSRWFQKEVADSEDLIIELREEDIYDESKCAPVTQRPLLLVEPNSYQVPPSSLLDAPPRDQPAAIDEAQLQRKAEILETKLLYFGIKAKVVAVEPGPVITTFEVDPDPAVKVQRIVNSQDDLSMALRAPVRVVAPIPGKSVVGIEVPNPKRERVYLSEIIESRAFQESQSVLTLALGKSTTGMPRVEDLARMPHLLIAGATGSGKSVALNAMIMSILCKASPRDVRFVMIDLKMLELSLYEGLPHQLVPVVTDAKTALVVLNNLCAEMDRRYLLMKDKGVRSIDAYNSLLAREEEDQEVVELTEVAGEADVSGENSLLQHEHLPKIVVIIDELAELMMISGRSVEHPIVRLAQKARACGIHLIVATQRPTVEVITGLIKANFPARISFQLPGRVDSSTILGNNGAERLLGSGDMLFLKPGGGTLERLHGAFVSEEEISRFTEFAKQQASPEYAFGLLEAAVSEEEARSAGGVDPEVSDQLYDEAVRIVTETRIASISFLQRRLHIGFNRAARLVERMEAEGVVSRSENGRAREVLVPPPS